MSEDLEEGCDSESDGNRRYSLSGPTEGCMVQYHVQCKKILAVTETPVLSQLIVPADPGHPLRNASPKIQAVLFLIREAVSRIFVLLVKTVEHALDPIRRKQVGFYAVC